MTYYCGIDLHSNNHYVCVIDENDNRVFQRKLDNDARLLIACLAEFKNELLAVAIESTFNWYWLSDALVECWTRSEARQYYQGSSIQRFKKSG